MNSNDANDQVQRIDQAFNSLEQLIAGQVAAGQFCSAFAQTVHQILPGGNIFSAHWLGEMWLIEPLMGDAECDRATIRAWLDKQDERLGTADFRSSVQLADVTVCLAAQHSPRTAWGALLWQCDGALDDRLTNAAFQLLCPLAELWESYWRSVHGQALETVRAGFTRELIHWSAAIHPDELAYRLVSDLAVATGCQKCALVESAHGWRPFQLLAISGLADVKTQAAASVATLKSMSQSAIAQRYSPAAPSQSIRLMLALNERERVILQWADADHCLTGQSRLSTLWPTLTQTWHMHRRAGGVVRSRLPYRPRWSLTRWIAIGCVLLLVIAIWTTRSWTTSLIIECPGRLEPLEQAWVFAPADGHIEQVLVSDRQLVTEDQIVATVASPALDLQNQSLTSEMETLQQKKLSLDVLSNESDSSTEAGNREARRMAGEILDIELRMQGLQRQRQMLDAERKKLVVRSKIPGRVIGGNLDQELSQKPVRTGDYLFRIVNERSAWQLELNLPERDLGHVQRAMDASAGKLPIKFSVVGMPGQSSQATITRIRSAVQYDEVHDSAARLLANVDSPDLPEVPIGTQVLARIDTGPQPWWFVLARPAIESLQRRGWF